MAKTAKPTPSHVRGADGDCYSRADDAEPLFTLLGRDRHAAALVELWAWMREKEGEDPATVADAREAAAEMRAHAVGLGRPCLTLASLLGLAATLRDEDDRARVAAAEAESRLPPVEEGDFVTAVGPTFSGAVGKVTRVFAEDPAQPRLAGLINVEYAGGRTLTHARASYRKATDAERVAAGRR